MVPVVVVARVITLHKQVVLVVPVGVSLKKRVPLGQRIKVLLAVTVGKTLVVVVAVPEPLEVTPLVKLVVLPVLGFHRLLLVRVWLAPVVVVLVVMFRQVLGLTVVVTAREILTPIAVTLIVVVAVAVYATMGLLVVQAVPA